MGLVKSLRLKKVNNSKLERKTPNIFRPLQNKFNDLDIINWF